VEAHDDAILIGKYLDTGHGHLTVQQVTRHAVVAVALCDACKVISQVL